MGEKVKKAALSERSRRVVEAVAETIIPSEGPDRPGAADVQLVDRLLAWLGQIPGAPSLFVVSCWSWEFCPLWSGRFKRFSSLGLDERTKIFESWESSRMVIRRFALLLTKVVIMAAFYNNPEMWPKIGYEPGCLSEPPRPLDTNC